MLYKARNVSFSYCLWETHEAWHLTQHVISKMESEGPYSKLFRIHSFFVKPAIRKMESELRILPETKGCSPQQKTHDSLLLGRAHNSRGWHCLRIGFAPGGSMAGQPHPPHHPARKKALFLEFLGTFFRGLVIYYLSSICWSEFHLDFMDPVRGGLARGLIFTLILLPTESYLQRMCFFLSFYFETFNNLRLTLFESPKQMCQVHTCIIYCYEPKKMLNNRIKRVPISTNLTNPPKKNLDHVSCCFSFSLQNQKMRIPF